MTQTRWPGLRWRPGGEQNPPPPVPDRLLKGPQARRADEWEARPPASPGHVAWPVHDPGAGIRLAPAQPGGIPPVRWPQGDIDWMVKVASLPGDPVPMPAAGTGGLVESGQLILFGGSLTNAATAATTLTLYDGMDVKGGQVAILTIPASGNAPLSIPNRGVLLEIGLFATVGGGLANGTLYVAHIWKYPFTPPGD